MKDTLEPMPKRTVRPIERLTLSKQELLEIKRAAESFNKSVQDFVLDSALTAARERLREITGRLSDISYSAPSKCSDSEIEPIGKSHESESLDLLVDAQLVQQTLQAAEENNTPFSKADWLSRAWGS